MIKRSGVLFILGLFVFLLPGAAVAVEFQVPGTNTNLNVGGYVKLDAIYNDSSAGNDSQANLEYVPGGVPLETDGEESELVLSSRESRFWIKSATPTDLGPLKTHLEIDFDFADGGVMAGNQIVSNSRLARIRHAYGEMGGFLFGQTWSLFMHLPSLPEINDFGGPTGNIFARQSQVRYTLPLSDISSLAIGVENPETFGVIGTTAGGADDELFPDIIVRYSMNPSWGNLSAAALIRQLSYDQTVNRGTPQQPNNVEIDDSTFTFAGQVGAVFKVTDNDKIKGLLSFGDGIGRYSSLGAHFDAVVTSDDKLDAIQQMAGHVGYEHIWGGAKKWRSNLVVGYTKADDPSELENSPFSENTLSVHANVLMDPVPGARLGLEFIHANRDAYNGDDGDMNRLQFSARFIF